MVHVFGNTIRIPILAPSQRIRRTSCTIDSQGG